MSRHKTMSKTQAATYWCLSAKDLEALPCTQKPNPRARSGPPMRLYDKAELEAAAVRKWGSLEAVERERARRQGKREERALKSLAAAAQAGAAAAQSGGEDNASAAAAAAAAAAPLPLLAGLPPLVLERVHVVRAAAEAAPAAGPGSTFVLYWCQTAIRAHENPALDVAIAAARAAGVPLLVAAFVLASHPYASHRRCLFQLQGLRDMQAELRSQGLDMLVYMEGVSEPDEATASRVVSAAATAAGWDPYSPAFNFSPPPGFAASPGFQALMHLAAQAAVAVTDDMPLTPHADWTAALAESLPQHVPLLAVDGACVLPMRLVSKRHEKAYAFRAATQAGRAARMRLYVPPASVPALGPEAVVRPDTSGLPPAPAPVALDLGWTPLDLAGVPAEQFAGAVAGWLQRRPGTYDMAVGAGFLLGGSQAGLARWELFRKKGLPTYAARRNDALRRDGVSRMSAYLHWGMVSPFKLAREASLDRSASAAKWLDEFFVWREVAFNTCLHRSMAELHSLAALPRWAQDTLARHAADPRPDAKPYAALEAAATADPFWDAMQAQLAQTGELHNNTRMTWVKALLPWAPDVGAALRAALHLNHRYALDGCAPASYGGVLWGFGLYDGPKEREDTPISGSIARRSTAAHGRRCDPVRLRALPPE